MEQLNRWIIGFRIWITSGTINFSRFVLCVLELLFEYALSSQLFHDRKLIGGDPSTFRTDRIERFNSNVDLVAPVSPLLPAWDNVFCTFLRSSVGMGGCARTFSRYLKVRRKRQTHFIICTIEMNNHRPRSPHIFLADISMNTSIFSSMVNVNFSLNFDWLVAGSAVAWDVWMIQSFNRAIELENP